MEPNRGMTRYSVRKVIKIVMRRWYWPLIFAAIFAIVFSFLFWSRYNSTYQVSSTLIPLNDQTNYYTASALIKNDEVLDSVKNSLDFKTSVGELNDAIQIEPDEKSVAVAVSIFWDNKDEATAILDALKANLTFAVIHSVDGGEIIWLDAVSSDSGQLPASAMQSYKVFGTGALIGLILGIGFALFLGAIDKRVFDLETVRYGSDVGLIGVIGKIKSIKAQHSHRKKATEQAKPNKQFVAAALYLNKLMETQNKKLVMCVAPTSKCGTTTVVQNIARVLSGIKKNVLIAKLTINTPPVAGEPKIRSIFPRVFEITISWDDTESYAVFLSKLGNMLSLVTKKFKFILIDCPALLENIQMAIFAEGMDATLMVCKYGKTKYNDVQSAVSLLSRFGAKPIYSAWNCADKYYVDSYPIEAKREE